MDYICQIISTFTCVFSVFACVLTVKLFPVTCEYIQGEKQFYYRAQQFYEDVPASEEGMMGDFVDISHVDLEGSRQFLKRFMVSNNEIPTHMWSLQ